MAISDFLLDDVDDAEGGGFTESETEESEKAEETPKPETQAESAEPALADPVRKKLTVLEEQNRLLQSQIEELKNRPAEKKQDYNYEPATQDDWAEDPNKAFEKNLKAALSKIQTEQQAIRGEEAKKVNERLKQSHDRAWQSVVNAVPEFATDPDLRQSFAAVFHNPANPYLNDPNGPMQAAAYIVQKMGLNRKQEPGETAQAKITEQKPDETRSAKVRAGVMHGSGRGSGPRVKALDPEYARVAKKLGLSEDSMRMAVESEAA